MRMLSCRCFHFLWEIRNSTFHRISRHCICHSVSLLINDEESAPKMFEGLNTVPILVSQFTRHSIKIVKNFPYQYIRIAATCYIIFFLFRKSTSSIRFTHYVFYLQHIYFWFLLYLCVAFENSHIVNQGQITSIIIPILICQT